jgi:hypothetical protein
MPDDQRPLVVSKADLRSIASLMTDLYDLSFHLKSVHERLLAESLQLIPCRGPCSLLQLTDFYSNGGRVIRYKHTQLPGGQFGEKVLTRWQKHVSRRASPIETALHDNSQNVDVGSAILRDLVDVTTWRKTSEGRLASFSRIGDLGYLWVRCAQEDLWVLALRRHVDEPPFVDRDRQVLEVLGEHLAGADRMVH